MRSWSEHPREALLMTPRADQGQPGGSAAGDAAHKHQHSDDDLTGKDASTGSGSRHSRESRQNSDEIDGKDGGTNRAGDERGWNAREQPRDAHGRFISEDAQRRAQDGSHSERSNNDRHDRNA